MSQFAQAPSEQILRPRDLGQLLDQSFKIFGRFWKPLVTVGLIGSIPLVLWGLAFASIFPSFNANADPMDNWMMRIFLDADRGDFTGLISLFSIAGIFALAMLLLWPLYQGALIDVAARAVLHMEPVPLGESLRVGARRYWSLLGTYLLKGLIWIIASPLIMILGLVVFSPLGFFALMVVTVFANHAIIIEGTSGGMPALKRAYELGRSRFWPLMGLGIVFNLLIYVLQSIIVMPASFAGMIGSVASQSTSLMGLPYLFQGLAGIVTGPFLTVALTLAYFDTRIRREGYDLEVMAQQQGPQQQPQPVIAPPPDPQP